VLAIARREFDAPAGVHRVVVDGYEELPAADVLVHLAEQSNVQLAEQSGDEHFTATVKRIRGLAEGGRYARILYGSSGAVYGDQATHAHRREETPEGTSLYARTKLECERIVIAAGGVAMRFANVIGIHMSQSAVLSRVLSQIPGAGDLVLRDDSAIRDFVWSGDAAACVAAFVAAPVVGPYNVGSGEATSVRRLAQIALAAAGQSHRAVVCEARATRVSQISLDITETCRDIAWQPRVSLDAAITKILESRHV
jgi:nucleoside-diphosphate-sugar epimerase